MKTNLGQRRHAGVSHEIGELYDKLVYWLYERQQPQRAKTYARRLQAILPKHESELGDIFAYELRSLFHESVGDTSEAIAHRKREIDLIRRLHQIGKDTAYESLVNRQYDYTDLRDRLIILAMLYRDDGNADQAIRVLKEARALCKKRGIRFGGMQLLRDYEKEKQATLRD